MARENQGLQIALIVFVMLTIVLSITTFLFVRQAADAQGSGGASGEGYPNRQDPGQHV